MHLIMAYGSKSGQSQASVLTMGLGTDGIDLVQMALKCVWAGNAPHYGIWEQIRAISGLRLLSFTHSCHNEVNILCWAASVLSAVHLRQGHWIIVILYTIRSCKRAEMFWENHVKVGKCVKSLGQPCRSAKVTVCLQKRCFWPSAPYVQIKKEVL